MYAPLRFPLPRVVLEGGDIIDDHFLPVGVSFEQSHTLTVNTLYFSSMSDEPYLVSGDLFEKSKRVASRWLAEHSGLSRHSSFVADFAVD